jgi:hypothetical protein
MCFLGLYFAIIWMLDSGFGSIGIFHGNCLLRVDSELDLLVLSNFLDVLGFFSTFIKGPQCVHGLCFNPIVSLPTPLLF